MAAQSKEEVSNFPFKKGENLLYTMNYGWFEIGEASVSIDEKYWYFKNQAYLHIQCELVTKGFFGFFAKLDVCMDSWVDPQTLRPLHSHRNIAFGNKIDIRTDRFSYGDSVRVHSYIEDVDSRRYHSFSSKGYLFDALSTYLFLRSRASVRNPCDKTISVRTFFSNDLYTFGMTCIDIQNATWEDRVVEARKYMLHFPESETFPKGKKAYVISTNDARQIPLKFLIEMGYGDFTFELKKISGI